MKLIIKFILFFPFNHHLTMLLVFEFVATRQDPLSRTPPAIPQKIIHIYLEEFPKDRFLVKILRKSTDPACKLKPTSR